MEDNRGRRALGLQHIEHFGVGIAVVNHQRLARPLSQLDMPSKCLALDRGLRAALQSARPIQIQTGLPDGHDAGMCGQILQLRARAVGEITGTGGMERDGGVHPRITRGGRHRPAGRLEVIGHRDHTPHTYGLGVIDDGAHVLVRDGTACIQMGVRINEGRERLGVGRGLPLIAGRHQNTSL